MFLLLRNNFSPDSRNESKGILRETVLQMVFSLPYSERNQNQIFENKEA